MAHGTDTGDHTDALREGVRCDPPKLALVAGDSTTAAGGRFQKGNRAQMIGHERRRRGGGKVNTVRALELTSRRVVNELFRSVTKTENGRRITAMTAPVANAIVIALRFRAELQGNYEFAEEVQRLNAKYEDLLQRHERLKRCVVGS